jgi:hypothetical protein
MPADAANPGDAYVDTIGLDVYDQYWGPNPGDPEVRWNSYVTQPFGLAWHRDFARAHGKRMTFPEWGVITRSDGYGGGDDPAFIRHMYDWIAANDVAFSAYFEYDTAQAMSALMSGGMPLSAATFQGLFGTTDPSGTPAPAPAPAPDPAPVAPDSTAPVTSVACNAAACSTSSYSKTVTVSLSARDTGSGVQVTRYTVDGSEPTATNGKTYSAAFSITKTSTVRFRSWDVAGNAEATVTQRLKVR